MPAHSATHLPSRHTCSFGQVTPLHAVSTHTPASDSQTLPLVQLNSPRAQLGTHVPRKQTKPASQGLPSSTLPSQLSSIALHFSGSGPWSAVHVSAPARHCI